MKLSTKKEQTIIKTADPEAMKGMYTADRVLRSWFEDFVDEDTGETVQMERKEIILDRGILLDSDTLPAIMFHLSSGDISEIEITNQQREGLFQENWRHSIWIVTAVVREKKKKYFLYAKSIQMAFDIAVDYLEQTMSGGFGISEIKEYTMAYMIPDSTEEDDQEDDDDYHDEEFYKIVMKIVHDEAEYDEVFICKASNAERAKKRIEAEITAKFIRMERPVDFTATIISATTIPCESIIDYEFCKEYMKEDEAETQ